jgi:hypothetical protein
MTGSVRSALAKAQSPGAGRSIIELPIESLRLISGRRRKRGMIDRAYKVHFGTDASIRSAASASESE